MSTEAMKMALYALDSGHWGHGVPEASSILWIAINEAEKHSCKWTEDEDGQWATGCDNAFEMNEGTPTENDLKFCCYCGKPLEQIDFNFDDEENV